MDLGRFETSLDVADIERSLAFYKALGFRQIDGGVDIRVVGLRKGDCRLTLFQGHLDPARTQLIFWQGQIEAIASDLVGKGLAFREGHPRRSAEGASALLIDPDGHPIYFINMPVNFVNEPDHAKPMPRYRPRRLKPDKKLGWYELNLGVADIARSRDFYAKLGFGFVQADDSGRRVTLQNGDARIVLASDADDPCAVELVFNQGEVEAVVRDLQSNRLTFERTPAPSARGALDALIRDPDGIAIRLVSTPGRTRAEPAAASA